MAGEKQNLEKLNIGGKEFDMSPWGLLGLSKQYLLSLLSRDEYCPVADKQPTEKDVIYTDPASGNPAGFHAGQCVVYPDKVVADGWGLSIAKRVETDAQGIPTKVYWLHVTDIEKEIKTVIEFYESFPIDDNKTYGLCNRKPELIADPGEEVFVIDAATAESLVLESLEKGVLVTDGADEEMIAEMRALLGDKLFNELAVQSVKTMEIRPQLSVEERIEMAKADYYQRKTEAEQIAKNMESTSSELKSEDGDDKDVKRLRED